MAVCLGLLDFISNHNHPGLLAFAIIVCRTGLFIESFYARLCLFMSIYDLRKLEGPLSPRRLDAVSRAVLTLRLFRRVFGAQLSAIRVTEWRAA